MFRINTERKKNTEDITPHVKYTVLWVQYYHFLLLIHSASCLFRALALFANVLLVTAIIILIAFRQGSFWFSVLQKDER